MKHSSRPGPPPTSEMNESARLAQTQARHVMGGVVHRHLPISLAMFCNYEDVEDEYWFCPRCKRRIPKNITNGDKPASICNNPPKPTSNADKARGIYGVVPYPDTVGGTVPRMHRTEPKYGVGFELKKIFKRLKIDVPPTCKCNARLDHLNAFNPEAVVLKEAQILDWFSEEATKRAIFFDEPRAKRILQIAIRRAIKARARYNALVPEL